MATYISNQTGLWSSASTWLTAAAGTFSPTAAAGAAPQSGAGDQFIIRGGNIVTYDIVGEFGNDGSYFGISTSDVKFLSNAIAISGTGSTLKCHRANTTSLSCRGSIQVGYGAIFDWGTTTDPVTANSELIFGTYSNAMSAIGSGTVAISARAGRCGVFTRNNTLTNYHIITMCGSNKTRNTVLSGNASSGTNTITAVDVTGWKIGDKVVIEPHDLNSTTLINLPLSSYTISNISGNVVTLNTNLPYTYPSGLSVGNFSSNITYKPAAFISGTNPVACGPQIVTGQNTLATYFIKNVSFENLTQPTNDNDNATPSSTFGSCYGDIGNALTPITFDSVSFLSDKNYAVSRIGFLNKSTTTHVVKNIADVDLYAGGSGANCTFVFSRFGPRLSITDSVCYRNASIFSFDQTNTDDAVIKNVRANSTNSLFTGNFSINNLKMNSCNLRYTRNPFNITFISNGTITDTTFVGTNNSSYQFTGANNNGAWSFLTFNNPTFTNVYRPEPITLGATINFSTATYFNLYNVNSVATDNRRYNSFYSLSSDYTNRNRGLASYKIKSSSANSPYYVTETTEGFTGTTKRFIGYIKYESAYGVTNLPYITFTDGSQTITQTFSCSPIPNTWQKFDISVTPASNGLITMTFTGQTSSTTANVYLDGVPFYPITPKARHYGFNFDESVPSRTINTLTTLTENQVSTLAVVSDLDYLYDAATYWSVTNPASSSYIDLYTANGTVLNFGSNNIIINNTGTGFSYNSASSTITINAPSLSAGTNFNTIKTSGTVTLSTGIISNIDINANLIQTIPTSLNGVYMLSSSNTLTYNTNTPIEIEYTNCTMVGVKNDGTALVTIKRTNSTVTESDAEVSTYAPTIIDLVLQGGYAAIYDNTGTRQYYTNSDGTVVLGSLATGSWSYRISKYGYQLISGNFTINPSIGGIIDISPNYTPDAFITVANVATVSGYTDLNTYDKIHDYLSYYLTTSTGINYGELDSESFGVLNFNGNLIMSGSASSIVEYTSGSNTLKLKSSTINDSIIFVVASAFSQDGGNTIGDNIKIRSSNLDSELYFNNVNAIVFYPTQSDRDNNTNAGISLSSASIYRFKYGSTVNGITFTDYTYSRVTVDGSTLLYKTAITIGSTTIDFGTVGNLQTILNNQRIINTGVQKASKLIPHTTNI